MAAAARALLAPLELDKSVSLLRISRIRCNAAATLATTFRPRQCSTDSYQRSHCPDLAPDMRGVTSKPGASGSGEELRAGRFGIHALDAHDLVARLMAAHDAHVPRRHAQPLRDQLADRLVGLAVHRRRVD